MKKNILILIFMLIIFNCFSCANETYSYDEIKFDISNYVEKNDDRKLTYVYPENGYWILNNCFCVEEYDTTHPYIYESYGLKYEKKADAYYQTEDYIRFYFYLCPTSSLNNISIKPVQRTPEDVEGIYCVNIYSGDEVFGLLKYYKSDNYDIKNSYIEEYIKRNLIEYSTNSYSLSLLSEDFTSSKNNLIADTSNFQKKPLTNNIVDIEQNSTFVDKNEKFFADMYSCGLFVLSMNDDILNIEFSFKLLDKNINLDNIYYSAVSKENNLCKFIVYYENIEIGTISFLNTEDISYEYINYVKSKICSISVNI